MNKKVKTGMTAVLAAVGLLVALGLYGMEKGSCTGKDVAERSAPSYQRPSKARADQGRNGPGRHQGPPPEALEACEGHNEGDACEFTNRRGDKVTGSCERPRGDDLVCVPEGGPPDRGNGNGPGKGKGNRQGNRGGRSTHGPFSGS